MPSTRPKIKTKRGFPKKVLASIRNEKILGIRAGTKPHRVIGIWAVVVEGRVFVRSWSLKPRSWYRTFLEEPRGIIVVGDREIPVRAVSTRSERLKDAVSRAYREKYNTPGSLYFVRGFAHKKRKDTTTELLPLKRGLLNLGRATPVWWNPFQFSDAAIDCGGITPWKPCVAMAGASTE